MKPGIMPGFSFASKILLIYILMFPGDRNSNIFKGISVEKGLQFYYAVNYIQIAIDSIFFEIGVSFLRSLYPM